MGALREFILNVSTYEDDILVFEREWAAGCELIGK